MEKILFISAGSLFIFLVFLYALVAFENRKRDRRYQVKLYKSYSKENLLKMEYDTAFYDKGIEWFLNGGDGNVQVTIDDILNESQTEQVNQDAALFVHIEDKGIEEICGGYNPENVK